MKKIKNLYHLHEEKMKLRVHELELEKSIHKDWLELKENLNPENFFKESPSEHHNAHWLVNGLHIAATSLTNKILTRAEEKIEDKAEKGIENLKHKINYIIRKK